MKKYLFFLLLSFISYRYFSQAFMRPNEWKKYRREVFVSLGSSQFLGDLGGGVGPGKDYAPNDIDPDQTRAAMGFGARYKLKRAINVVGKFSYVYVAGDDAQAQDPVRFNRNLNFRANIFELSGRIEAGYQSTKRGGNRYGIRKNFGKTKAYTHNVFGFVGVGVYYFNPKGRTSTGDWVNLYPLHTEGQGLPGGPKQYSRINVNIPIGAYYKLTLNKVWSVGLEFAIRKTFTDYIDDVAGVYYDPQALTAAYGPMSAQMADPSLTYGPSQPANDGTPAQRGDNNQKDVFMSLEITGSYIFKKVRKSARLRSKF